jgi:hypothetical protein
MFAMFMLVSAALIYDSEMGATEDQTTFITSVLFIWFIACCVLSLLNTAFTFLQATRNRAEQITGKVRQSTVVDGIRMTVTDDFLLSENPIRSDSAATQLNTEMSTRVSRP